MYKLKIQQIVDNQIETDIISFRDIEHAKSFMIKLSNEFIKTGDSHKITLKLFDKTLTKITYITK